MFNEYPYRNLTDLNLDFLLNTIKKVEKEIHEFVTFNALKYADPIQWDITRQYEKNTIVIDPLTGTAYISAQAVPYGVALTNTDYWSVVFDLERFVTKANNNFTLRVETQTTTTATFNTPLNNWLIWGGILYRATTNIIAGDRYVVDSNIVRVTVADTIGIIQDLDTNDTSNIVAAINEVLSRLINEAQARQDADTVLQQNIDAEAQARADAVAAEAQARQDADTALQQNIDAEAQARQDAVAAEAQARQNADAALQQNIDNEAQARQTADTTLQQNINNEEQARQGADAALRDFVVSEIATVTEYHNAIVLGNSYASGTGAAGHGIYYFLRSLFENSYLYSGSGTSFIDYDGAHSDDTFLTQLSAAIDDSEFDNSSIDTIFIIGAYGESRAYIQNGRNMATARDALRNAVNTFASTARNNFPNLKHIIYANAESRAHNKIVSGGYTSFVIDSYAVDVVCYPLFIENGINSMGWIGIDALYYESLFSSDYYHPNESGYKMITRSLLNRLSGGYNSRSYRMDYSYDVSSLTGVAGSTLAGRHLLTAYEQSYRARYLTIPAGSFSLRTTYTVINLDNAIVPPTDNALIGELYTRPSSINGQAFNFVHVITIENDSMVLKIRSDRNVTGSSSSDLAVPFIFGEM